MLWLFSNHGIIGVLSLMVALLFTLVFVLTLFGVESGKRSLEQIKEEPITNVALRKA